MLFREKPRDPSKKLEVLLIKKRYSYGFSEFMLGRYSRKNTDYIIDLINQMTMSERLLIWSLDFKKMWYNMWLGNEIDEFYHKKYTKFYLSFIKDNNGTQLRNLLKQAKYVGDLLWEIPKGKKKSAREDDIHCAIREFREETKIPKSGYYLLPNVKRKYSFVSAGVRYIYIYYVAIAMPHLSNSYNKPIISLKNLDQIGEVGEIRWMDMENIRVIDDQSSRIENVIKSTHKEIKKCIKMKEKKTIIPRNLKKKIEQF